MPANQRLWLTGLPRPRPASLWAPAAIGLLLLIGLAVWVIPVRVEGVVVDNATGEGSLVTAWDTSRWQALTAVWWQVLLLALAFTAVLSVAWHGRSWVLARAAAVQFFAASLLVHSLLLLGLWTVPLARSVVERAEVIRVAQASQLLEDPQQAHSGGRPDYEKVADLRPEEAVTPDPLRQAAAPADVPDDLGPLAPTISGHAVRSLPLERLLFVPPRNLEVVRQPQAIERRSDAHAMNPVEIKLDLPEPPPAEPAAREQPLEDRPVIQVRQGPPAPVEPDGPKALPLPELQRPRPADLHPEAGEQPRVHEAEPASGSALVGRRQPGRLAPAAPAEPAAGLKAEATPAEGPPADVRVGLPRLAPAPHSPAGVPDEPTAPTLPRKQPAAVAIVSPPPDVLPRLSPAPDRLPRAPARTDREALVEEKVVPPPPFLQRQEEVRQTSLKQFGGTDTSEAAVERGLDWLAAHQNADGSWSLHNAPNDGKHPHYPDPGSVVSDAAGTGVALLPFLGAGHTHQAGKHKETVSRALQWLVQQQRPDGTWDAPQDPRPMYGHGIASITLCEAYGMTQDPKLRAPAQKALDYIVKAQHLPSGGWRYHPGQPSDTSVTGWQLMALKSGEMAGLSVPQQTLEGVKRWLASVEVKGPVGGQFGYQSASSTSPAMTAQGLLCLQYLGVRRDDPRMRAGTDYLLQHLPQRDSESSYYWYNANQVMYHMQGKHWKAWNDKLRDLLVSTQITQGPLAGSWTPADPRERPGGRLYATALRLLMLEIYYRHLPLYQQLEK